MYQLIVSDLDGTLLDPDHRLTAITRDTIVALQRQGVRFCIATGRHFEDVKVIADQFPFPMFLITCNGARVHDRERQVIYRQDLAEDTVTQLLDISARFPIHRNIYDDQTWFVEEENAEIKAYNAQSGFFYQLIDFSQLQGAHVCKMFFWGDHGVLEELEQAIHAAIPTGLNVTFSLPCCLEVMVAEATKGNAVSAVLKEKNISAERTIAFGDGMNDREMLTLAGKGLVMGNAHDKLKHSVPELEVIKSNADNGVAVFLRRLYNL